MIIPETPESIDLIPVPGGQFNMGPFNENLSHQVKVDSFWIGKYEITWNQYKLFVDESFEKIQRQLYQNFYGVDIQADTLSTSEILHETEIAADVISTPTPPYGDLTLGMGTAGYPATNMTHYAAFMFTKWLTVKTGTFFRLPTEAE